MSDADAATLTEIRDALRVLRVEAIETRKILRMLVGVLNDTQITNAGLREELHYVRTARERGERAAELAEAAAAIGG